jgi:hypothetical protein
VNGVENGPRAPLDFRVEQAGRRGDLTQSFREILVRVTNHFHAGRLENGRVKVKTTGEEA